MGGGRLIAAVLVGISMSFLSAQSPVLPAAGTATETVDKTLETAGRLVGKA